MKKKFVSILTIAISILFLSCNDIPIEQEPFNLKVVLEKSPEFRKLDNEIKEVFIKALESDKESFRKLLKFVADGRLPGRLLLKTRQDLPDPIIARMSESQTSKTSSGTTKILNCPSIVQWYAYMQPFEQPFACNGELIGFHLELDHADYNQLSAGWLIWTTDYEIVELNAPYWTNTTTVDYSANYYAFDKTWKANVDYLIWENESSDSYCPNPVPGGFWFQDGPHTCESPCPPYIICP